MRNNKDIRPLNDKREEHGYWERCYDGKLWYKCFYHNGKEVGYEELYDYNYNCKISKKKYYL